MRFNEPSHESKPHDTTLSLHVSRYPEKHCACSSTGKNLGLRSRHVLGDWSTIRTLFAIPAVANTNDVLVNAFIVLVAT
jgi:hypothetical protein